MSEQQETIFADGIFFNSKHENAPDFVLGSISFKVDEAVAFLQKYKKEDGYVNVDFLRGKPKVEGEKGKPYFKLNTWEKPVDTAQPPSQAPQASPQAGTNPQDSQDAPALTDSDIPF